MKSRAEEFREAVRERSPGRYPNRLREMALEHLASVRLRGKPLSHAARELGVDVNTLRMWEKRSEPVASANGLLPVEIREPTFESEVPYVVVASHGVRVECATAESVARLLAVLS